MKKRYSYVLMYAIPALLASTIISFLFLGAAAGFAWIYVFGDDPWPSYANTMLVAIFVIIWLAVWFFFLSVAYVVGRKHEAHSVSIIKHVMVSVSVTVLLLLLAAMHQWRVGNIGAKPASVLCSDYCREKGFAGSGMPPENAGTPSCSCFDAQGRETRNVPMEEIDSGGGP